jgi:hypothetical protein
MEEYPVGFVGQSTREDKQTGKEVEPRAGEHELSQRNFQYLHYSWHSSDAESLEHSTLIH